MKKIYIMALIALTLGLTSCGSSPTQANNSDSQDSIERVTIEPLDVTVYVDTTHIEQ